MGEESNHRTVLQQSNITSSTGHFHLLPEKIYIPGCIIFNPDLPPSVIMTWIKIYTLLRGSRMAPTVNANNLAALIGKSRSTLFKHLSLLQAESLLEWHLSGHGRNTLVIRIYAIEPPLESPDNVGNPHSTCNQVDYPYHHSYFPERIMGYISYQDEG